MKKLIVLCLLVLNLPFASCQSKNIFINESGSTIRSRFDIPNDYQRLPVPKNSYAEYLVNLKLKVHGSNVYYHDGRAKLNKNIYCAVIDMEIGKQNLQQCADAVMRLKGEYLYKIENYTRIKFNLLSTGKPYSFDEHTGNDKSYLAFRNYMDFIFAHANTASLHDEMQAVKNIKDLEIGDVFIQKKQPYGHAVIVLDVAISSASGQKLFLIGQSYMPAQETQILLNPTNGSLSPWYKAEEGKIITPQWTFEHSDLRRFKQ